MSYIKCYDASEVLIAPETGLQSVFPPLLIFPLLFGAVNGSSGVKDIPLLELSLIFANENGKFSKPVMR